MSQYRHVAQPSNPQRSLQLPAYIANLLGLHTTNGSQLHVGCTTHQKSQGAVMTLVNLPTAASHVGTSSRLHVPSVTASKRIEMTLLGPGLISSSKWQKILSRSPVQLWNPPWKIQTKLLPLSVAISSIKFIFRNHSFGNMIRKCARFISVIKIITSKKWYILDLSKIAWDFFVLILEILWNYDYFWTDDLKLFCIACWPK